MKLVLASTSPFRKELLQRLGVDFSCASPDVDETPVEGESIEDMVVRLSELKASAIAREYESDSEGATNSPLLPVSALCFKQGSAC